MLAIRLQRTGRKGYPTYRLAVQESQLSPSSGRVVAYVGTYNPHTKDANIQVEAAQKYLDNGAQPTPRVVKLLKEAGVKLEAKKKAAPKTAAKLATKAPAKKAAAKTTAKPAAKKPAAKKVPAKKPAAKK